MTQATKRQPIVHTKTGDVTLAEVLRELDSNVGSIASLDGAEKEARIAAGEYIEQYMEGLADSVMQDADQEREDYIAQADGFWHGFLAARTGEIKA